MNPCADLVGEGKRRTVMRKDLFTKQATEYVQEVKAD